MADKAGKKYGLILKKKPTSVQLKPSIFGGDDSGDEQASERKNVNTTIRKEAEKKKQMRQTQFEMNKVLEEDPTAYDYDAVYDKMAERKANLLAAKATKADKKPKYIGNLLKFAEVRKKEEERRVERQVQKEREAEGSEFADKDAFVTSAFRRKMQEMAEEEERQRKRDERDGDVTKQSDLSKFYRNLLDRNVSTGGSFDTEQHTETHEENTKDSRPSPSRKSDQEGSKTGRRRRTSESERKKDSKQKEDEGLRDHQRGRGDEEGGERKRPRHEAEKNKSRREGHDRAREKSKKDNEKHENERDERRHEERKHEGEHDSTRQEKHETEQNEQHESRKRPNEVGNSDKSVENSEKLEVTTTDSKSAANDKEKLTVNKFAKHSSNETVLSARERYLARQKTRAVVVQTGSDDEN